jgi:hypothetical protein
MDLTKYINLEGILKEKGSTTLVGLDKKDRQILEKLWRDWGSEEIIAVLIELEKGQDSNGNPPIANNN